MEEDAPQKRSFGNSELNLRELARDLRLEETASRREVLAKAREALSTFRAMFGSLSVALGDDQQEDNGRVFKQILKILDEDRDKRERAFPLKVKE